MNEQQEPTVTLQLKASQINAIIAGLEELPHKVSRIIIDEIIRQGQPQLQAQAPENILN